MLQLEGEKYSSLTVIRKVKARNKSSSFWECRCLCGNVVIVSGAHLKSGHTKSCGCLKYIGYTKKHGRSRIADRTYKTWKLMRARCNNEKDIHYKWYGSKGIKVCVEWKDFDVFLNDMGERPEGKTLDRLDPEKGYSKENCRWATTKEQALSNRGCYKKGMIPWNKKHGTAEKITGSSGKH